MNSESDNVHCDSLTGATITASALSMPPSMRPSHAPLRRPRWRTLAGCVTGGAVLAGGLLSFVHHAPAAAEPEALHVDGQTVSYSAGFAARAGIRTMEVREAAFAPVILVSGKTSFDPRRVAAIGASALGMVRRIAKYEGDSVKRGEVLAEIGSPLQARMEAAASLRASQAPQGVLGVSMVRSPLDGVVVERRIVTGQSVRGERVVFVVADLDRLALELPLDEAQARALRVGDRVELSREASPAPATVVNGSVSELGLVDAGSRKIVVRVGVDNRARDLRPGQAVSARIFASRGRALVIPNRALAWIAGHPAVFVSDGQHSASASAVTLGDCDGEQTEVRVGLASGQRIVSDGVPKLKEASFL